MQRVAVVGTGYVGLATGACLAHLGHDVTCVDIDDAKVERLQRGEVPIREEGLDELVAAGAAAGRLRFTTDAAMAVSDREFVYLCLPTPADEDGSSDLRALFAAVDGLAEHLAVGSVLITKSTVPVGTSLALTQRVGRPDVHVASNPEFLREGTAVADFLDPQRVVVGCLDADVGRRVAELSGPAERTLLTDPTSAELIKYATNAYLAMRLSFVNEVADLCAAAGGRIDDVTAGLGADPRIGATFLRPGPGWGGSCFPKDTRALAYMRRERGLQSGLVDAVIASNDAHMHAVARRGVELAGMGGRVAVWGLTFKAGTDDLRDSPALAVVTALLAAGCEVCAFDPQVAEWREPVPAEVRLVGSPVEACGGADALMVLTEWAEFATVAPAEALRAMRAPVVYDARGVLDVDAWRAAGARMSGVGRA